MNRKIFLAILTMIIFAAGAAAQGLVVKKFYHAERDFTANSGSTRILDQNEEPCALIKVRTNERGFWFDSGRLLPIEKTEEQTQRHPGEIYVWVQSGAKRLSIGHKQLGNLYDYDLGTGLLPGQTYILGLVTGEVQKKDNLKELFEKGKALYDKTNYAAAVPLFKQAAEQGHAEANTN